MPGNSRRDAGIWPLAGRQHGLVTRGQLVEMGFTRSAIAHAVHTRRLWRVHRGVFAVGRRELTREGVWLAAVMACGSDAVLSHLAAASLWGLRDVPPLRPEVSVPSDAGRPGPYGIDLHRAGTLRHRHTTRKAGVPVTTLQRTLADIAAMLDEKQLKSAVRQAERLHRLDLAQVRATLDEFPRASYRHTRLRRLLDAYVPRSGMTESVLEARFLDMCFKEGFPMPETQVPVGAYRADFLWPDLHLVVEVDGRASHDGFVAFRDDRARDRAMDAAGLDVLRFTSNEVLDQPDLVARQLSAAIDRRAGGRLRSRLIGGRGGPCTS